MDDEADVNKIVEVLNVTKEEKLDIVPYEEEFLDSEDDYDDEFIEETSGLNEHDLFQTTENFVQEPYSDPVSILTTNERAVVDSCSDPDLKKILLLNRTKNLQLIQLYKKIKDLLMECKQNILEKNKLIKTQEQAPKYQRYSSTGAWRLGAPYFKDKNLFSCPPNADTIRKKENNELSTYDLNPIIKWSANECDRLLNVVKLNYNLNRQTEIKRKLMELTNSMESESVKDANFKELTTQLKDLQDNEYSEVPPLGSDTNINWARISDHFLKGKHTDTECRAFWHLYIHPHINKSPWSPAENNKLKQLVKKHQFQNWTAIVRDLGTNRSIFTACVNYFSYLHNKYKRGEFTYAEDKKLVDLVRHYKMGSYIPWIKVSEHFQNRTRHQLHHRYTCYLSQDHRKRGRFTEAEDLLLIICVDKFGKKFKKCREILPHRQQVQLKARYNTNLQYFLKKGSWSVEEDKKILDYVNKYGTKKWAPISKELKRSRGQVRQRYQIIYYHLDKDDTRTLEDVPRRKHLYQHQEEKYFILRAIADEFKDKPLPTLEEVEKLLKDRNILNDTCSEDDEEFDLDDNKGNVTLTTMLDTIETEPEDDPLKCNNDNENDEDEGDIDHWLTEYFCQIRTASQKKVITSHNVIEAVGNVEEVLNALQANLVIPENFDMIPGLDNIDVAILMHLSKRPQQTTWDIDKPLDIIPPNLHTVIGLESLMKKCSKNKQVHKSIIEFAQRHPNIHCPLKREVENELLDLNPRARKVIENERNLFFQRFHSLFKWPALMSTQNPHEDLEGSTRCHASKPIPIIKTYSKVHPITEDYDDEPINYECYSPKPIEVKRTYSRANASTENKNIGLKKVKLTDMTTPDNSNILKLTPVTDKSVIENLLRDQSKKLFTFEKVKTDGKVRAVIKQVKFPLSKIETSDISTHKIDAPSCSGVRTFKCCPATITSQSIGQLQSSETDDKNV